MSIYHAAGFVSLSVSCVVLSAVGSAASSVASAATSSVVAGSATFSSYNYDNKSSETVTQNKWFP